MKKEIWKDVKGYEGLYQVSNLGRVKGLSRKVLRNGSLHTIKEKILKSYIDRLGYVKVSLSKNGKHHTQRVHRLVAESFIPNPLNLSDVNHISEDKTDCTVSNLEWMSHKDNCNYGTRNERISKKVLCVELKKLYGSLKAAAADLGLDMGNINRACNGIYKTTGGYHWEYVK